MKLLLLIISLMFYKADPHSKNTYCINKDLAVQKLNESIPIFQIISNEMRGRITHQFNNALHFNINDFEGIKNLVFLTGEISEKHLNVNFTIKNLDELKNFNEVIASSLDLKNIKFKFTSIVISLINDIFQSSILPEEDIEISNEESNFLTTIRKLFNNKNEDKIIISLTHKFGTCIIFNCYLNKNTHNVLRSSKPNESQEHEKATLLDKKRQ